MRLRFGIGKEPGKRLTFPFFIVLESDFIRYLDPFLPFLYGAIQRHEEYQACSIAIGLVGDLCRSLNDKILPSVTDIMTLLGQALAVRSFVFSIILAKCANGTFRTLYYIEVCDRVFWCALEMSHSPLVHILNISFRMS